jgi:GDP-4-dehydro-6-deoxy-D-mannose reductase
MPSIYQQILEKRDMHKGVELEVGNMDVERDIGAVQDLVEAFYKIISVNNRGQEVYNLCSGVGKSLRRVVQEMAKALGLDVSLKVIPERIRQGDPLRMIASCEKLSRDYDWQPKYASNEKQLVQFFLSDRNEGGI